MSTAKVIINKSSYDANTKIWSGIQTTPRYGPDCSLGQVALQALMKDPDHIAQICYTNGKQYTNREIALLSIRVAQHLKKLQFKQCDIMGLCGMNSDYVVPLFYGAMLAGMTISSMDNSFDKEGFKHTYSITKPVIMFCDGDIYKKMKAAFEEINLNTTIYTINNHIQGVPEITEFIKENGLESTFRLEPLKLGHNQTAAILCSSGTTGLPKGVCMSHAGLLNSDPIQMNPDDRFLCFSTLYWISGLMGIISTTNSGATRVMSDRRFSVDDLLDIVEKHKITVIFGPPTQIALVASSPRIKTVNFSSVTDYLVGGSATPYVLIENIRPYMPTTKFHIFYGLSEMAGVVVFGDILPDGSTGEIAKNCQIKIIDDENKNLSPGVVGEICIHSIFPWAGYYGNPKSTADTYDNQGWIHSGDLGCVDQNGRVRIVDRKKDILKYQSYQFSPTEIEFVIAGIPGVEEVCACGIPDLVSTHLPAAAIVKVAGSNLTAEEVCHYVASKMVDWNQLRGGVYFMNEIPKTASGKHVRSKVVEICARLKEVNSVN